MHKKETINYFKEVVDKEGAVHLSLIDPVPNKVDIDKLPMIISCTDNAGTDGFMVGGSTALDTIFVTKVIKMIKNNTEKPVILFPSGPGGLSKAADAIFFMMPLNSTNPYFVGKVQALAAPIIKQKKLEVISLAYLIFHPGGSAGFVCEAEPIPRHKPEIAAAYTMAADLIGFDLIYLEAGSGASHPISSNTVNYVEKTVDTPIVVGGGIKTSKQAGKIIKAGADIIVQGTKLEISDSQTIKNDLRKTINYIKKGKK